VVVIGVAAVVPAWLATIQWQDTIDQPRGRRCWRWHVALCRVRGPSDDPGHARTRIATRIHRDCRQRLLTCSWRSAFLQGELSAFVGIVPVVEGIMPCCCTLLRIEPRGGRTGAAGSLPDARLRDSRDSAATAPAVDHDRLGARRRGAGLALSPHPASRTATATALLSVAFVRLALNPAIFIYEPRGGRVLNWHCIRP
jgi:hypothetical protein